MPAPKRPRTRVSEPRTKVTPPRPIAWFDPKGISELRKRRLETLAEVLDHAPKSGLKSFHIHRNACGIVTEEDGEAECSCVPVLMYTGHVA